MARSGWVIPEGPERLSDGFGVVLKRFTDIVLRSKTPDGVLQEIYGHLCAHYAIRSLIGAVAAEFDEDPLQFSFTPALRAARRSLAARPAFSPSQTD